MSDYKKVTLLDNQFEAQLLTSVLNEREVPHLIHSYHDSAFDGLFQALKGWGYVSAPADRHGEILEILEDIRSQGEREPDGQDA